MLKSHDIQKYWYSFLIIISLFEIHSHHLLNWKKKEQPSRKQMQWNQDHRTEGCFLCVLRLWLLLRNPGWTTGSAVYPLCFCTFISVDTVFNHSFVCSCQLQSFLRIFNSFSFFTLPPQAKNIYRNSFQCCKWSEALRILSLDLYRMGIL